MWTKFLWYNDDKSETVKDIILNKIQKIMLEFVSRQHAEKLREAHVFMNVPMLSLKGLS